MLAATAAAASLTLASCGGDDAAPVATTAVSVATGAAAAQAPVIRIDEYAFTGVTEVPVGTTITIVNDDRVAHTWSSYDDLFDSGTIEPGGRFEYTFDEPGTYPYGCNLHGGMNGVVTVTG